MVRLHDSLEQRHPLAEDVVSYEAEQYRNQTEAPIRKLTVDLIKTYRKINDVRTVHTYIQYQWVGVRSVTVLVSLLVCVWSFCCVL